MVSPPRLVDVRPIKTAPSQPLYGIDCFQHRNVAVSSAAEVVHLATAGRGNEGVEGADNIRTMDLVANLLAFVAFGF